MKRRICNATIKTIMRSPITWICSIAVLVRFFSNFTGEHNPPTTYNFHKHIAGYPYGLLLLSVPLFISVIASVDVMKDRKNRFKDITKTSGASDSAYYFSKICAYLAVGLGVTFFLSYLHFFIEFFQYNMLADMEYTLPECLWMIAVRCFAYSMAVIPVYVSLSVCVSLLCRSPVAGIVSGTTYVFARYLLLRTIRMDSGIIPDYIYHLPQKIMIYFYCLNTRAQPGTAESTATLLEVILSYAILLGICTVLLTSGYFAYHKQTD